MVNPIKNNTPVVVQKPLKKKPVKEVDVRINKAAKSTKTPLPKKGSQPSKISEKIAAKQAYLSAEKAAYVAKSRAFETQKAAQQAQKAALASQRAHMAQQAAAARRARASERAKKAAERAAKKAFATRRVAKIKAYLARPEEKKRGKALKKYIKAPPKKKTKA